LRSGLFSRTESYIGALRTRCIALRSNTLLAFVPFTVSMIEYEHRNTD